MDGPVDTWIVRKQCQDEESAALELLLRAKETYYAAQQNYWNTIKVHKQAVTENIEAAK